MELFIYILVSTSMIPGLLSENHKTSTDSGHFRLVGGASRCHGDLEMKPQNKTWKPVNGKNWNKNLGNIVCAQLNCGSVVSLTLRDTGPDKDYWLIRSDCDKPSLIDCARTEAFLSSSLELNCSDSVRLVNGSSVCSGRLEVYSNESRSWSSVCEGHLDLPGAQVVCRELGCGAPGPLQGAFSEVKAFQCEGHESALLDCGRPGSHNCSSGPAVDLTCTDPDDVRLVGGASRCYGQVQIKHDEEWRYMSNYYDLEYLSDLWTLKAADVICGRVDCGSAVNMIEGPEGPGWFTSSHCLISTSALMDCVIPKPGFIPFTMFLNCSESVRLVNGSSMCSGRLEVYSNRSWSSVCEEDVDLNDTQVVCRELKCGASGLHQGGLYGQGDAPVWISELQCEGNESTVLECRRSSLAGKNCSNGTAAGLTCSDPGAVKLVGQPSHCEGVLEFQHWGDWRPVYNEYNMWDMESASSICQFLDCGSAVYVNGTSLSTERDLWRVSMPCVKVTSGLRDCIVLEGSYQRSSGVKVVCSGLLPQPNISLSDGVYQSYQQGFRVLVYFNFTITCSVKPLYPGGSFWLISDANQPVNLTQPAVNHSAHFLLSFWGRPHTNRGNHYCVYLLDIYNHSFSSPQSSALYLTTGDLVTNLIIRALLIVLPLLIFDLCVFYFYKVSMRKIQMEADARRMRVRE